MALIFLWEPGAMIRFTCPNCRVLLESPDHKAGRKIACPNCTQRLQIPTQPLPPPHPHTVLAPLVIHQPDPNALQPTTLYTPAVDVEQLPPRSLRWRKWLLIGGAIPAVLVVGLVLRLVLTGGYWSAAGKNAENRSRTRTADEELVRRYIVRNTDGEVRFLTWGPHMTRTEVMALFREGGFKDEWHQQTDKTLPAWKQKGADIIIRVRYHGSPLEGGRAEDQDHLFVVYAGAVVMYGRDNEWGDDWKKEFRKEAARFLPRLNP